MKILYINEFINCANGARIHGLELISAFQEIGVNIKVYPEIIKERCLSSDDSVERIKKVLLLWPNIIEGLILIKKAFLAPFRILQIFKLLNNYKPDVILIRPGLHDPLPLLLKARRKNIIILEINAPMCSEKAVYYRMKGCPVKLWPIYYALESAILRSADGIYVVSKEVEKTIRSSEEGKPFLVKVIPNGVALDRFIGVNGQKKNFRSNFAVGFVGSLHAWHGVDVFISSINKIKEHCPDLKAYIVGEGQVRKSLEKQVCEYGIQDKVTFLGRLPYAQVVDFLFDMDVLVAPYNFPDEFYFSPLKVFEYMAAGKGIVATRCGQISELLVNGEDAFLIGQEYLEQELAQALMILYRDDVLRDRLGKNAQNKVRAYSWLATATKLRDFCCEVLSVK